MFLKEDGHNNGIKYGTILVLAVLAGMAATFSSFGNATIDYFGLIGISASGIWIALAAIAGFVGFVFAYLDWSSKAMARINR